MDRSRKEKLVAEFHEIFESAVAGVLVDFQGTTVEELTTLRKSLFGQNSKMRVLKNTLAKKAAEGTPFEGIAQDFVHSRAFVYSTEDAVQAAKVMTEQAKANEKLKVISGVLVTGETGQVLDATGVKDLGNLPSKEELLVKLLYVMNATTTNFVRTLNEVPSSFVRTLAAVAESKS